MICLPQKKRKKKWTVNTLPKADKKSLEKLLRSNCDMPNHPLTVQEADAHVNADGTPNPQWTLADLFIRQSLNNGCNGFGMKRVNAIYDILRDHKEELIAWGWVNEKAFNNSGFILWSNYDF